MIRWPRRSKPREGLRYQCDGAYCGDGGFNRRLFSPTRRKLSPSWRHADWRRLHCWAWKVWRPAKKSRHALDAHHFAIGLILNYRKWAADPGAGSGGRTFAVYRAKTG
jgi:hypothetical protein